MVKSSVFKWFDRPKTDFYNVRFSNVFGFRAFGIRALTVYHLKSVTLSVSLPFECFRYSSVLYSDPLCTRMLKIIFVCAVLDRLTVTISAAKTGSGASKMLAEWSAFSSLGKHA